MDPRLLGYYNQELQFIREMGAEFAREFPKIAGRLAISGVECADPYVERLLEGFAFLTARIQLQIDAEFPRFTQQLLQMVYPDSLCPMPSMAVVQFNPDFTEAGLAKGFEIARGSALTAHRSADASTACEYRTAHAVQLWPVKIVEATYQAYAGDFPPGLPLRRPPLAVLRLRLKSTAGLKLRQIGLRNLQLFLPGTENIALRLYEALLSATTGFFFTVPGQRRVLGSLQGRDLVRDCGFGDEQALLPPGPRTFQGHRLLQEYFAFPGRFLFVDVGGFEQALRLADTDEIDLVIALGAHDPVLEGSVSADDFAPYCTPAVNLFPRRADRIHLSSQFPEHHVVPDRTRPMDFEVYRIVSVAGYGEGIEPTQAFEPFYAVFDGHAEHESDAYFTMRRLPRVLSEKQRRVGPRTNYVGSEVFVSLVDTREAPFSGDLHQLGLELLCTNRDLPLRMPLGNARGDFTLDQNAPVESIRARKGPTPPVAAHSSDETSWRLIGLLAQNYVSLLDSDSGQGAEALRELLALCASRAEAHVRKQIGGLRSAGCRSVVRRLPSHGPVAFGRGIEVTLEIDEAGFGGSGAFLMGSVLRHYLARHVSLNSFVEGVLRVSGRGEVMRWPARIGARAVV